MKKNVVFSIIVISIGSLSSMSNGGVQRPVAQEPGRRCTMEAKLCPDGSSVGRVGPNCEFAPCPSGAPVGRVGAGPQKIAPGVPGSSGVVGVDENHVEESSGPITEGFVRTSAGIRIHYLSAGQSTSAPALVPIPGWRLPAYLWNETVDPLLAD